MSPEEQERLRQAVRDAANDGLFTPSSHLRYHIQFPGAWGGANWGSTAADPATGMLYVRSLEMPSYRKMSRSNTPRQAAGDSRAGPREQQGYEIYTQICAACHGPGQMPMRSPAKLGAETFRTMVRQGQEQMPAFSEATLPPESVDALEAFLLTLPTRTASRATNDAAAAAAEPDALSGARGRATPARSRPAGIPATAFPRSGRRGRSSSPTT